MSLAIPDPRNWLAFVPATLHTSPLYTHLWEHLQHDADLLSILRLVDPDQPLPITFFTAINFLVLAEPSSSLAHFYPYLRPEQTWPVAKAYPFFRTFVLAHQETLREILPTARLQTNEVMRCANLLPAFLLAHQRGGGHALNMVEIGSSVGLNLHWNQYGYRYVRQQPVLELFVHDPLASVQLSCEIEGEDFPLTPTTMLPRVAGCQGIEIYPRDLHNDTDLRWVRAAIWPEEIQRYRILDAALTFARRRTPALVHQGDAAELLPGLLAAIPPTQTAVVWHSYALNQGPVEVKAAIEHHLFEASRRIPLYRVGLEVEPTAPLPQLTLSEYRAGQLVWHEVLAHCTVHGERMTWLMERETQE